jgi:hypothetical protein
MIISMRFLISTTIRLLIMKLVYVIDEKTYESNRKYFAHRWGSDVLDIISPFLY